MESSMTIREFYPYFIAHYAIFLWAALYLAERLNQRKIRAFLIITFWQVFFFPFMWVYIPKKYAEYQRLVAE